MPVLHLYPLLFLCVIFGGPRHTLLMLGCGPLGMVLRQEIEIEGRKGWRDREENNGEGYADGVG